jgi:ribosomal protein S18 acetylase RimI-like enzyme
MAPRLGLRAVQGTDAQFLARLFATAAPGREFLPPELLAMQLRSQVQQWSALWPDRGHVIVESDGVPAGRLWTVWSGSGGLEPGEARLVDISLLREFRSQGLGSLLLRGICAAADASGVECRLAVANGNVAALALYTRCGFVVENFGPMDVSMVRAQGLVLRSSLQA